MAKSDAQRKFLWGALNNGTIKQSNPSHFNDFNKQIQFPKLPKVPGLSPSTKGNRFQGLKSKMRKNPYGGY